MNKWFAIFKTGRHTDSSGNEKEWTENDLDKIAETYNPQNHEAPIVIGHPKTNSPAFGWVEKLKRVGDTLYALPKQLANEFAELVNKGLFKKRSISLYPDGTLRHVGFLGAQPPAVKGLPDVEFNEGEQLSVIETDGAVDLEEAGEGRVEREREYTELQIKYAAIEIEKNNLEKELQKQKRESEFKEFNEKVDKAIAEGKLLPKMKESISKIFEVLSAAPVNEFSEGAKIHPVSVVYEFLENMPRVLKLGEGVVEGKKEKNNSEQPVSEIVAAEIRKQMRS